jgi:4-hydroxybenzoate polyprenyltransferase
VSRPRGSYLRLVAFEHSIFALPFALQGAWLAARGMPSPRTLLLVVLCAVAARTAAMGFNRLLDARLDAQNPRTANRELPAGRLKRGQAAALVLLASALFVAGAFALNPLCGRLSFAVLFVLLSYSATKRFTVLAHFALGLALALAPLGAWLAVRGSLDGELGVPLLLAGAVLTWVAGFDLIYATQDAEFDRRAGLHSVPARYGIAAALHLSRGLHAATVLLLVLLWRRAGLALAYLAAVALAGALLVWEHRLVRPGDLSRVDMAFFTLNGWIGVGLFAGLAADLHFFSGGAHGP